MQKNPKNMRPKKYTCTYCKKEKEVTPNIRFSKKGRFFCSSECQVKQITDTGL